jgi:hypothetical protein
MRAADYARTYSVRYMVSAICVCSRLWRSSVVVYIWILERLRHETNTNWRGTPSKCVMLCCEAMMCQWQATDMTVAQSLQPELACSAVCLRVC